MVYTGGSLGSNDLFRLAVSGVDDGGIPATPVALVTGPVNNRDAAVGDGQSLLFVSDRDGFTRVNEMAMDDTGAIAPVAPSGHMEEHPAWTPDNRILVARVTSDDNNIYVVAQASYTPLTQGTRLRGHPAAMPIWCIPTYGDSAHDTTVP